MVRKGASARRSSKNGSRTSGRVSLLDPAAPEPAPLNTDSSDPDDRVYLHAATIFQNTHLERPAAQRLVSFGKRSEVSVPEVRGEASQRLAFQLAFNTLKYQELLEDVLIDSGFCASQPMPDGGMSLVAVLLTDLLDRKFLPRLQPANQEQEEEAVREVEACLLRFRTKLVASLARCRIKHDLLTLENILPEKIRHRQERARELPLYAWINTLRSSFEKVREVLRTSGFSCVKSVAQLEGRSFCTDTHCQDLLVFPNGMKRELTNTGLLTDCRLVLQDKSCCVGPWALRPLLAEGGDVLMTGCFSARTVAHVSAVSAHTHTDTHTDTHISPVQSKVIVCVGDEPQAQKDELQNTLAKMGCKNVKLLPVSLECVDVCDVRLQEVRVALVMPACSLSAVSNPVDYIMQENRDPRLMLDLSHGSVSPEKLQTLVCRQRKDLQRVGQFPQVRAVLYSTCSVHSEENEEVLKTILSQSQEHQSTAPPYRLSSPGLPQDSITEDEDDSLEMKASFFRLEASDHHNGCFVALLTRQPEPEVKETPQQVLARAAAKGLLDGLQLNQPISRERRGRRSRRTSANHKRSTKTRPHTTQSDQSRVTEFLNYEMRGSNPEPAVSPRSSSQNDQPASSRRLFQGVFSRTGHTPNKTSHTPNTAGSTSNTPGHTSNKTGPSFKTKSSTSSTTDHTLYTTGSTSNTTSSTSSTTDHTLYTTGSTSNTTGSTSSTTGHTPYTTGSTSSTTDHTPYTTGSTFKTTGTTSHITGPVHNTTGSTPNLSSFSEFYCTGLTGLSSASASVIVVHSSTPAAPPKGRHEVLRPTTVMFPPVLSSSGGLLPQRRSYVLTSPTHTIKSPAQTRNSTPAPPRTQAAFRVRLNHLRPWL
ncbi:S-adenosyl-L-methionine-dependent methyltransferases superfamily protein [Pimephales promelas]|nr:S-adenosyl-L-methionine-dependent methyltransferases superfamily protein [Pimephales promelas]